MLTLTGGSRRASELRVVTDADAAAPVAERDRQLSDIARRLVTRPELGIRRVVVCGLRETYKIVRIADALGPTEDAAPSRAGQTVTALLRLIATRGHSPGDR